LGEYNKNLGGNLIGTWWEHIGDDKKFSPRHPSPQTQKKKIGLS